MQLEKGIVQSRAVFDDADVQTVIEAGPIGIRVPLEPFPRSAGSDAR